MKNVECVVYPVLQDKRLYRLAASHVSRSVGSSMTVPDETMSIKEIMRKHVSGMNVSQELLKMPLYNEDASFDSFDLESLKRLDLADRSVLIDELKKVNETELAALKAAEKAVKLEKAEAKKNAEAEKNQADAARSHEAAESKKEGGTTDARDSKTESRKAVSA